MPTSGTGTGTIISSGGVLGSSPAEPLPYTLLSLPRFAKIMGINPVHFAGGYGDTIYPLKDNACSNIWARYSWQQSDIVSHYELAMTIEGVERDIANVLGYWPAPVWTSRELSPFPSFYRPELTTYYGRQYPDGLRKSVSTRWKKLISGGRRGTTLIKEATTSDGLQYLDLDSDGFPETARVTATTTVTSACEIKVYHAGYSGLQGWEIRPHRNITLSGGTVTIDFDSWLFIDPSALSAPTDWDEFAAINLNDNSNLASAVDVYREFNDTTTFSSRFFWEPTDCDTCQQCSLTLESGATVVLGGGSGDSVNCTICGLQAQNGCTIVQDRESGSVTPSPGSYDSDADVFTMDSWAINRDPDQVQIWYYSGAIEEEYLRGVSCEPLSHFWAQTIAYMTAARLERPMCGCSNVIALGEHMRKDIAFSGDDTSFLVDFGILSNPFGTKRGELIAWQRVSNMGERIFESATL